MCQITSTVLVTKISIYSLCFPSRRIYETLGESLLQDCTSTRTAPLKTPFVKKLSQNLLTDLSVVPNVCARQYHIHSVTKIYVLLDYLYPGVSFMKHKKPINHFAGSCKSIIYRNLSELNSAKTH